MTGHRHRGSHDSCFNPISRAAREASSQVFAELFQVASAVRFISEVALLQLVFIDVIHLELCWHRPGPLHNLAVVNNGVFLKWPGPELRVIEITRIFPELLAPAFPVLSTAKTDSM